MVTYSPLTSVDRMVDNSGGKNLRFQNLPDFQGVFGLFGMWISLWISPIPIIGSCEWVQKIIAN